MIVSSDVRTLRQHIGSKLLILPSVRAIIFDDGNRIILVN
jgi:hypothetical protein